MKKLPILAGAVAGALIGLFASISDSAGLKIVMASIGIVAGIAVGGAIARIGQTVQVRRTSEDEIAGLGVTPEDLVQNYWRDKGEVPLSSALEPEHGRHQFDPEKLQ